MNLSMEALGSNCLGAVLLLSPIIVAGAVVDHHPAVKLELQELVHWLNFSHFFDMSLADHLNLFSNHYLARGTTRQSFYLRMQEIFQPPKPIIVQCLI